ncbi:MAG TPA: hypothetical protein PLA12_14235 [Candidatus Hydrogenedens sp.]|nr:hypothetical protein [Candidatus Hydrogenedens sp.]
MRIVELGSYRLYGSIDFVGNDINLEFIEYPYHYLPIELGNYTKDRDVSFELISSTRFISNQIRDISINYGSQMFTGRAYNIEINETQKIVVLKSNIAGLPPGEYYLLKGKMKVYKTL